MCQVVVGENLTAKAKAILHINLRASVAAGLDRLHLACKKAAWAAPRSGKRVHEYSRPVLIVTGQIYQSRLFDPLRGRLDWLHMVSFLGLTKIRLKVRSTG